MPRPQPPPDAPGALGALDALGAHDGLDALDRWLAAERSAVDAVADAAVELAAEAAFAELLVGLPRPAPPPGFADRVLARARRAPGRRWLGWRLLAGRAAPGIPVLPAAAATAVAAVVAAGALLGRFGLPAASGLAAAMAARLGATSIAGLLRASVDGAIAAGQLLADVVDVGGQLLLLVRAVAEPLATAPMAALAAACLLVSVLATRCLVDLIQRDRRWVYADPI